MGQGWFGGAVVVFCLVAGMGSDSGLAAIRPHDCLAWMRLGELEATIASLEAQPAESTAERDVELRRLQKEASRYRFWLMGQPSATAQSAYEHRFAEWKPTGTPWHLQLGDDLEERLEHRLSFRHGVVNPQARMNSVFLRANLSKQFRDEGSPLRAALTAAGIPDAPRQMLAAELLSRYRPYSPLTVVHSPEELASVVSALAMPAREALPPVIVDDETGDATEPVLQVGVREAIALLAKMRLDITSEEMTSALRILVAKPSFAEKNFGDALLLYLKATDPLYGVDTLADARRFFTDG